MSGLLAPLERSRPLLALILALVGLWVFAEVADEVREGEARPYDRLVLLSLRSAAAPSDPLGPAWLEAVAQDITSLGGVVVLALITGAVVGFLVLVRRRVEACLVAVAVGGGAVLSTLLKLAFGRDRPDPALHATEVVTASFPSGHAMLSAVVYLTLAAILAQSQEGLRVKVYLLAVAVLVTGLVGISRVYLGVHWPTDVLGGWSLGLAWALLCWLVAGRLRKRGAEPV
ncbi:phosphatase PAP2 family protein [Thiohalorhabdus sp.]|uniref:phosphatase PAP2 family protein n=1 Tax=Thiohalorhabdus sp. TaxID=3094134 RepID=UPI002FC39E0D